MRLLLFILTALTVLISSAQVSVYAPQSKIPDVEQDSLTVSLITKYPAAEIYELYGHEAVRIKSNAFDVAFDYGLFDFDAPNFIYRFVKGETDYMAGCHDFRMFLDACKADGASVVEQTLDLTQDEAHHLLQMLAFDVLPENRTYRYNYVKNNCATKIIDRIDQAIGHPIEYSDSVRFNTFRNEMRYYNRNYPWYQFGIDLVLGEGLDYQLTRREEMFVPMEMMRSAEQAVLYDGRKLVKQTELISKGLDDATLPPTSTLCGPLFWAWIMTGIAIITAIFDIRRKRINKWVYALWFTLCGLAGILIFFLVFISVHEATSPNLNAWWLNPFALIVPILIWTAKGRKITGWYMMLNFAVTAGVLLTLPWHTQATNPAFYPLILSNLIYSGTYTIIEVPKSCNNKCLFSALSSKRKK